MEKNSSSLAFVVSFFFFLVEFVYALFFERDICLAADILFIGFCI